MITIDGNSLTIGDVVNIAMQREEPALDPQARQRVEEAHHWAENLAQGDQPAYGINTGFGIFSDTKISRSEIRTLNRNLILSHAVASGPPLPSEVVRAAMLIRANTLAKGYSGVRPLVIDTLIEMLNKDVIPVIPSQGSLGSSGDLALLSHLALVFTTDSADRVEDSGQAIYQGQVMDGKAAMAAAGIERLILGPKEGLAINNGATFSAAMAALLVAQMENLVDVSDIALAMSLEAMLGVTNAYDPRIHEVRGQTGQITVAANIRALIQGSTLMDSQNRVQDAYSLRCAPQIQGPVRDTLDFVRGVIVREINAVTDNPLLFGEGEFISGGNFHGQPVGMAMDFLKIACTEMASVSERRIFRLTDPHSNAGLPPMLIDRPEDAGVNSGMMMLQYTAASLALENQHLAGPNAIHSMPTSGGQEDHNANSMTAARRMWEMAANTAHVLAIEIYCAARALDLRMRKQPDGKPGIGTAAAHQLVRAAVPYRAQDAYLAPDVEQVKALITDGKFVEQVMAAIK